MGLLITLGILAALLFIPLGIGASYDLDGGAVWFNVGPLKIVVFPGKKKADKKDSSKKTSKPAQKGGSYTDFLPLLENVLSLLTDLRHKLVVAKLRCILTLADGDPCDLAVNYGRAWGILGGLLPMLERFFVIKKRDLSVECDFTADKTRILFYIQCRISLGRLLGIIIVHGVAILKKYYSIINERKGGVQT